MAKHRALRAIEDLSPGALADALAENGFSGCRQLIVDKEIDGRTFLNLSEVRLKQYKLFLKPSDLHRLWSFLVRVREHPEDFVLSGAQYLNYKPPLMKKPSIVGKSLEVRSQNPPPVSASLDIADSLKEKFKNVHVESEESQDEEFQSADWSDDEPVKETLAVEDPNAEMEAERRRKVSAEIFTTSKQKLEKLFGGVREEQPVLPPRPASLTRIYVNIEELRMEKAEMQMRMPPKPPMLEIERVKMPPKPPVLEIERVKMPPKPPVLDIERVKRPPKPSVVEVERLKMPPKPSVPEIERVKLPPKPPITEMPPKPSEARSNSGDFANKRNLINLTLSRKQNPPLPIPPKLHNLKLETTLIDLQRAPERPPKGETDEQMLYEPEPSPDDTYEPPPNVAFIPKSIERFLEQPPPIPKKFPPARKSDSDCDDDGYLITSQLLTQSKESLFSKQDVPLPPIPPSTTPSEDELRRNEHFQDMARETASLVLRTKKTGSFLLRPSNKYFCTLMIKSDANILNVPVIFASQSYSLLTDQDLGHSPVKFQSLNELIVHYMTHSVNVRNSQVLLKT